MKKIIICGPPHSGKSVFVAQLMRLLPPDKYMVIMACPDGEGHWSNIADQGLVKVVRHKGKHDATFMQFTLAAIRNCQQSLVLVDVGGIRSPENEQIFKECEGFVILSSSTQEMAAWKQFGEGLGLKCLAELDSVLPGESVLYPQEGDGILRGLVTGLERGQIVNSPVIDKLVGKLIAFINQNGQQTLAETQADVNGVTLADQIGIADRNDPWMGYRPWHTPEVIKNISHLASQPLVKVWNIRSGYVGAAIAAALKNTMVELFDVSQGYIMVPHVAPQGAGTLYGLAWETIERDTYTLVKFRIQGEIYNLSWLSTAYPPAVNPTKGVVISGKPPIWLVATFARAYAETNPWIAYLAINESGREQQSLGGRKWGEVYSQAAPAVVLYDSSNESLGALVPVPTKLLGNTWRLGSGELAVDRLDSHILSQHKDVLPHLAEALGKIQARDQREIIQEVDLGRQVGTTIRLTTEPGDEIIYAQRVGRTGLTRFIKNRQPEPCSKVMILLRLIEPGIYELITAYVGAFAPREPWDIGAGPDSFTFWNTHALIWGMQETVPGTETTACPWKEQK